MKSLFRTYLVFSATLTVAAWGFSQNASSDYQLLWEIKGKGLKQPSYVFGSMHSNDPRLFQFPDSLYVAFEKARAVVLETDVSALFDEYDVRLDLFNLERLAGDKPYTTSREATRTVYGNEDGRPQFLDAWFQQTGYCGGKLFFPLEGLDDQLKAVEKLSNLNARTALSSFLFSREAFVQSYIQGDIANLSKMLRSQLEGIPGAYDALITKRNSVMANGLDTLMRKQSVFCAIGSGHLHGSDGVLQLLRNKGYLVRAVKATYSNETIPAKQTVSNWRTYTVRNETFGFSVQLSGKPLEFPTENDYHFIYQELGQGNTYELVVQPVRGNLEDYGNRFVNNQRQRPVERSLPGGQTALEGMVVDPAKGAQWQRIFIHNNRLYTLICYGGNKFMHSDRPKKYFDRLTLTE